MNLEDRRALLPIVVPTHVCPESRFPAIFIPDGEPDLVELQRAMVRTQKATVPR